jgi:hypothetical protein
LKPLHDLATLRTGIASGAVELRISEARVERLIGLLGDEYMQIVKKICRQLDPSDFCGNWPQPGTDYSPCADVYGIMRDAFGDRSEEEYAWYIKLGVRPGEGLSNKKWFLSFHPTQEIRLANQTVLRTTALDYEEEDDE